MSDSWTVGCYVTLAGAAGRVTSVVRREGRVVHLGVRNGDSTYGVALDEDGELRKVSGPSWRPLRCAPCLHGDHCRCQGEAASCGCGH